MISGELGINSSLSIVGPSDASLAISGNDANRVFNVSPNAIVVISGLTVCNGKSSSGTNAVYIRGFPSPGGCGSPGGGIYNEGSLTLSNCVITGNCTGNGGGGFGDASYSYRGDGGNGGNGGAIWNSGHLTLDNCTVTNNSSGSGGFCYSEDSCQSRGGAGGVGAPFTAADSLVTQLHHQRQPNWRRRRGYLIPGPRN